MKTCWIFALGNTLIVANAQSSYPDCASGILAGNQVCNATLSPAKRAAALVAEMTNDEKLENIVRYAHHLPPSETTLDA